MVQILRSRARPPRYEARRLEILRGAAVAFREHGFHDAQMRDIAAALGMTPGNLYHYFRGKADLLRACQEDALARLLAAARRLHATVADPVERLRAMARAHVACLLEETGGSAAHLEFRALPEPARRAIARARDAYERTWRRAVVEGVRAGVLRAVDVKLCVLAILGALNGTVSWWRPDGPRTPAEIGDAFADTLVGGLLS